MKIFIINLKKDTERKKKITKSLKKLGINYEIIEWIYAKDLTLEEINRIYDKHRAIKELWRELKIWEIWCALSHFKIFNKILKEKIEYSLILEDDVIINDKLLQVIKKIKYSKNIKWDYLTLNYTIFDKNWIKIFLTNIFNNYKEKNNILVLFKNLLLLMPAIILDFIFEIIWKFHIWIWKRFKPLYLTWWYFITNNWAKKILSINKKVFLPQDILIEKYRNKINLKFYFIYPLILKQNNLFESNIQKEQIN